MSQTCRIKLLRFRGLSFNYLFIYFYLFADDNTDRNERNQSRHISCLPESVLKRKCHLQTCVHKRTHRYCCKWSTLHFTQASSLRYSRVDRKSDYDEWSWLLFEKSDCEIATYINVKLAWWRHWKALTANKFRCLFWEGPCEWAKNRLGVQARWNTRFHFFVAWFSDGSKSSGRVSEQKTSSNLKIKLTSQMSGEFTVICQWSHFRAAS